MADKSDGPKERIRLARTPVPVEVKEPDPNAPPPAEGEEAPPPQQEVEWHYRTPPAVDGPVVIGVTKVLLPGLEEQQAGFELPRADARRLIAQFPDIYKRELARSESRQAQQQGQPNLTTDEVLDTNTSEKAPDEGQQGKGGETLDPEATVDRTQEELRDAAAEEEGLDAETN